MISNSGAVYPVQQWSENRDLSNAEHHRRRNGLIAAVHDLLCASTDKWPNPVERSVSNAKQTEFVTFRSSAAISISDQSRSRAVFVEWTFLYAD